MRWHLTVALGAMIFIGGAQAANNATGAAPVPDPYDLAKKIDRHLSKHQKDAGVVPAPRAEDAEFLRRVMLDLHGRIPLPRELHDLLNDPSPEKRRKAVEKLLDSPGYVNHFINVYRGLFLPEASTNF